MSATSSETDLRRAARNRIASGRLPRYVPERAWGGKGTGRLCALCDDSIPSDEMEIEVESWIDDEDLQAFQFHVGCHSAWDQCARDGESKNENAIAPGREALAYRPP
jgi:hypothetical protein